MIFKQANFSLHIAYYVFIVCVVFDVQLYLDLSYIIEKIVLYKK